MRHAIAGKLAICGFSLVAFASVGLAVAGPSRSAEGPATRQASFQTGYGVDDLRGDCRFVPVGPAMASNHAAVRFVEKCD